MEVRVWPRVWVWRTRVWRPGFRPQQCPSKKMRNPLWLGEDSWTTRCFLLAAPAYFKVWGLAPTIPVWLRVWELAATVSVDLEFRTAEQPSGRGTNARLLRHQETRNALEGRRLEGRAVTEGLEGFEMYLPGEYVFAMFCSCTTSRNIYPPKTGRQLRRMCGLATMKESLCRCR